MEGRRDCRHVSVELCFGGRNMTLVASGRENKWLQTEDEKAIAIA
jgi:hypothetical protein